ncbi:SUR7/PalI family-domain-containing protein [Multifurca ochricompacta]|uniref:SUR7/PalI family-domain-containing protein n=1 Tax=Multifurca ochricompacta TaxID=376703 RepID=A0AAD4MEL1_9AGAM|nr:SUR7/PalI family-domain-containing protein [Multifurca ochricompacta]
MRPATPGFLVTLTATILLAVVSFSVPWFKSVFFLKASLAVEGIDGTITFGVLGYCLELSNGTTCSKPSIGYQLEIDKLVGNRTKVHIPEVIVKWITYALVLHIVALVLAAISSVFGLLAHVREFSMSCFSTCISGVGAAITLLAFIFDLAFFFLAKSRLNSVKGGSATMGNAIWLTLAAWLLLFFSGCFYGLGRCCVRRRPRDMAPSEAGRWVPAQSTGPTYEDQMRLDAVKAEADRKARQKQGELGLPSFPEYDPTQPLTADAEHDTQPHLSYRDAQYAAAPVGTRAVDEYYNPTGNNAYPPRRQPTTSSERTQQTGYAHSQQTSGYAPSGYAGATAITTTPAVQSGYLNVDSRHEQYPSQTSTRYGHEQYTSNTGYGHGQYGNSDTFSPCRSSPDELIDFVSDNVPPAQNAPRNSGADPFQSYTIPQAEPPFDPSNYATGHISPPPQPLAHSQSYTSSVPEAVTSYYTPHAQASMPPSRSYTLGGGGYGGSTVPALHESQSSAGSGSFLPYPGGEPITPSAGSAYSGLESPTSPRGPRVHAVARAQSPVQYDDSPPMYDDGIGPGVSHRAVVSGKR